MTMNKISELAAPMAEKFGISQRDAESFVSAFTEIANNALRYDKQLKIKGLGTFKVQNVNSRESVDVNTGQRIIINGRDKIAFTPEATLRERVNSPFSQFETFVINDDVDFSEIDKKYNLTVETDSDDTDMLPAENEQTLTEDMKPTDNKDMKLEEEALPTDESMSSLLSTAQSSPLSLEDEQEEPAVVAEKSVEREPAEEVKVSVADNDEGAIDIDLIEKMETGNAAENNEVKPDISSQLADKWSFDRLLAENSTLIDKIKQLEKDIKRHRIISGILTALLFLLLLGGVLIINKLDRQNAIKDTKIGYLEHQLDMQSKAEEPKEEQATKPEADSQETAVATDDNEKVTNQEPVEEKKAEEPVAKPAEPAAKPQATNNYDADPRVRLGAYRIVGTAETVTVKEGQTLKSISKAHLGPDMECYVEALNGKKEVKPGDKLQIPKLELKKKSKN